MTLNHNGTGNSKQSVCSIFASEPRTTININNMNFNLNNKYSVAIVVFDWRGNVTNSVCKSSGNNNAMIFALNWTGNMHKTSMSMFSMSQSGLSFGIFVSNWVGNFSNNKISLSGKESAGIFAEKWTGNILNSNVTSTKEGLGVGSNKWIGKAKNLFINIKGLESYGFFANSASKGTLEKSKIYAQKGVAVIISKNIKVVNTIAKSSIYEYGINIAGPRISAIEYNSYISGKSIVYKIVVSNVGESKSKISSLTFGYGKYKKTVNVKALGAEKSTTVTVKIPKSYLKSTKKITTTFINGAGKKITSKPWTFR